MNGNDFIDASGAAEDTEVPAIRAYPAQPSDVREFLQSMFEAVGALAADPTAQVATNSAEVKFRPATTPRRSLASPEHIISLIDGKPYKSLRRHLTGHGLTPDEYRQRYGLKGDEPRLARVNK